MKCQATACHCKHLNEAEYVITTPSGHDEPVSRRCADLHVFAGYPCRKLSMGDIMASKFTRLRENEGYTMTRYWISWIQRTKDYRPLHDPPNEGILGWWCSGYSSDGNAILCAVVGAADEPKACDAIFEEWPEAKADIDGDGWRFFEDKGADWVPGDRFPINRKWMAGRFGEKQ